MDTKNVEPPRRNDVYVSFPTEHEDDVRAIVQRAVKDISVEKSLKTYEEVWLSKIFELREHTRSRLTNASSKTNTAEKDEEQVS